MADLDTSENIKLHFRRFEWKYIIDRKMMHRIISELSTYMELDDHISTEARDRGPQNAFYMVRSVYMDNSGLGSYHEKMAGCDFRKKMRVRTYEGDVSDDTKVFVEIKRKKGDTIIKDRVVMPYGSCQNIFDQGVYNLDQFPVGDRDFLKEFLWTYKRNCMRPLLNVSYKRCPFVDKVRKRFRVTFDYDIDSVLVNGEINFQGETNKKSGDIIMEVKYDGMLPSWFYNILKKYSLSRSSFSKYCFGVQKVFDFYCLH